MSSQLKTLSFSLEPADNERLVNLCGQCNEHLKQVEDHLAVKINSRGNDFHVIGEPNKAAMAQQVITELYKDTQKQSHLSRANIHLLLQQHASDKPNKKDSTKQTANEAIIRCKRLYVKARGPNQVQYVNNIRQQTVNFGIGPAGTGKTYLAVACAVEALEQQQVNRIVLTRPAVEAGERLGFLPGDLAQKIDPYLRPLYDALYEMMGFEKVAKLIEKDIIEIAPLAYMRGRTLNDAFVIVDESQNTTTEQMKMILTRLGFNSKAVVTGDISQIDLPNAKMSGLKHVINVLQNVDDISFTFFRNHDVVRHKVVQSIVQAYEDFENKQESS